MSLAVAVVRPPPSRYLLVDLKLEKYLGHISHPPTLPPSPWFTAALILVSHTTGSPPVSTMASQPSVTFKQVTEDTGVTKIVDMRNEEIVLQITASGPLHTGFISYCDQQGTLLALVINQKICIFETEKTLDSWLEKIDGLEWGLIFLHPEFLHLTGSV